MSGNELIGNSAFAASFLDTLGVNTKGGAYLDGYKNSSLIINSLNYLGIDSVRDSFSQYGQANPVLDAMAAAGIKFDFLVSYSLPAQGSAGLGAYLSALKTFQAEHPGALISVEGINEINLNDFSYNGSSTPEAAAEFQRDLYNAIKADPSLSKVAVINLTVGYDSQSVYAAVGDLSKYSDFANAHAYPHTSSNSDDAMQTTMDLARNAAKGDPLVITETGYTTLQSQGGVGASDLAQAKLITSNLFNAFENGSAKTYLYELFDTPASETRGTYEGHFGLFNADGSPKLAATAIHNITTILSSGDTGATSATSSLNYSFGTVPANTHSLMLEKSGGVHDLVVWNEKLVWNDTTDKDITNAPVDVTINLGSVQSTVRVYDPLLGLVPIATYSNVSSVKIPLSDHPLIIEIGAKNAVTVPVQVVSSNLSLTSEQLVAQIDALATASGLSSITLTDSHTLGVSSIETMNYIIGHYGNLLGKIAGGYNFSVTYGASTWEKVQTFDANGDLTLRTDYGIKNGVVASKTVFANNGAYDYYAYNITGKTYTTEQQTVDAKGRVIALERKHADGTYDYQESKPADGSQHYVFYDTKGNKLNDVSIAANGNNTTLSYSATTGLMTRQNVTQANGDLVSTTYVNGIKASVVSTPKIGDIEAITYDTAGKMLTDVIKHIDGGVTTKMLTNGVVTTVYDKNADGTLDNYFYKITGKTYTTEHVSVDAKGRVIAIERFHADGTRDYQESKPADGSKHFVYYDTAGHKLNDVSVAADGTNTTLTYSATTGLITRQMVTQTDGDIVTTTYVNGVKASLVSTPKTGDTETVTYDAAGKILTDVIKHVDGGLTTKVYANGVVTTVYDKHGNGTQDNYWYNIAGKTYVAEHQSVDAKGKVVALERLHADGTLDYQESKPADGSKHYVYYDAAGHKLNDVTVAANGTNTTLTYSATTGALTRQMVTQASGDLVTTNYISGIKANVISTFKTGDIETLSYDTAGKMLTDVIKHADGGLTTKAFTSGVLSTVYDKHANGTQDNYWYNITGKTYVTEHQIVNAKGVVTTVERLHADGTYDYKDIRSSDGSRDITNFTTNGKVLNHTDIHTDGSRTVDNYLQDGTGDIRKDVYNTATVLQQTDILHLNGTHAVSAYADNQILHGGAGDDIFYFRTMLNGKMDYDGGNDTVWNFDVGTSKPEHLVIDDAFASSFSELHLSQKGNDVLISFDDHDSITLKYTNLASIKADSFIFD